MRSSPERAVRVRSLAGDTVPHCVSQCLSPPRSINGYGKIVGKDLTNCGRMTCDGLASRPGEVEIIFHIEEKILSDFFLSFDFSVSFLVFVHDLRRLTSFSFIKCRRYE